MPGNGGERWAERSRVAREEAAPGYASPVTIQAKLARVAFALLKNQTTYQPNVLQEA